jgi:glycerol kinase
MTPGGTDAAADRRPLAVAIDLGSTMIKAAVLDADGFLAASRALEAPPLAGEGEIREGDAVAYAAAADELLTWLAGRVPRRTPLGIASQRSSFLLWDRDNGKPLAPMISWQDRRAADWCTRQAGLHEEVVRTTGLVLSAHYVGPKLATLVERERRWRDWLQGGQSLFGTLECYLTWRWSERRVHETDVTMAARTAMFDLERGDWSDELLARFDVPREVLPRVRPTTGRRVPLANGLVLTAGVADQAAGALALFDPATSCTVVNLGTGAFVLRPLPDARERLPGYLTAPILAPADGRTTYAVEGSINGAGAAVDRFGHGPTEFPEQDPRPEAYCLPDAAGLGAPFWRPEWGFTLSDAARTLDRDGLRRVTLEGLLFRIRQVVEDLSPGRSPDRLLLAGGLTREPAVARGLAALVGRSVHVLDAHEAVLIGAARMATGLSAFASPATSAIDPGGEGAYLRSKYPRWREWLQSLISGPRRQTRDTAS